MKATTKKTASELATDIIQDAFDLTFDEVVEDYTAEWHRLVDLVESELGSKLLSEDGRGNLLDNFTQSLTASQKKQFVELSDDDTDRLVIEHQAAFELGRAYQRAVSGGAR